MAYLNQSLKKYLADLAARLPAPGGGSASALVGAEGVALLEMVLNFTVDKKGYEEFWDEGKKILKKLEDLRERLSSLIDEDVRAYGELDQVFKMPRESEKEKEQRRLAMEIALKKAEAIPEEICHLTIEAAGLSPVILEKGNKNLASDVGVAMALLVAAFKGGRLNVEINLKSIKDLEFCNRVREKLDSYEQEIGRLEKEIETDLKRKMGG